MKSCTPNELIIPQNDYKLYYRNAPLQYCNAQKLHNYYLSRMNSNGLGLKNKKNKNKKHSFYSKE